MSWKLTLLALAFGLGILTGCTESRAERREDRREERAERVEDSAAWEKLGERTVNYRAGGDHDTIMVTASEGRYTKMMLKVENSALELHDVEVTFGDGQRWSPDFRHEFREGSTSRIVDLPGDARFIRKVEFHYRNLPRGGRAQIELWGRK